MTSNRFSRAPFNLTSTGVGIWAAPRRRRRARCVAFGLEVLARRGDAHGVQSGLHGDAHLIRIDLGLFAISLHAVNPDLEDVLTVDRKIVRDGDAGARVERQVVAQSFVAAAFERVALRVVDLLDRLHRRIADGQTAHLVRRRQIAVEQCRRGRQHRRDVVESVTGIVDREPFAGADVDGQQITDRRCCTRRGSDDARARGRDSAGPPPRGQAWSGDRSRTLRPAGHPAASARSRVASRPSAACAPPSPRSARVPERSSGRGSGARVQRS